MPVAAFSMPFISLRLFKLLDYLKAGESIDDFLEGFPTVSKEQVIHFLEEAEEQIVKMVA